MVTEHRKIFVVSHRAPDGLAEPKLFSEKEEADGFVLHALAGLVREYQAENGWECPTCSDGELVKWAESAELLCGTNFIAYDDWDEFLVSEVDMP